MGKTASETEFWTCRLTPVQAGSVTLLDCVGSEAGSEAFFAHGSPLDQIALGPGMRLLRQRSVAEALWLTLAPDGDPTLRLAGQIVPLVPAVPQPEIMAGRNVIMAVRNGEPAEDVLEWLRFHAENHRLGGALILSRARPGSDPAFERALRSGVPEGCRVLLVEVDHPLGDATLPAEAHPFCVAEAPGKDRMEIPPPAPWESPFAEVVLYEWARHRFLSEARAVAKIDVHDLMVPEAGANVFDRAVASEGGYVQLLGRHCFPWRVRNGARPGFGDHICVQFDAVGRRRRWCVAPEKLPDGSILRLIRVGVAAHDPVWFQPFYRCMALRHPTESVSQIVPKTSLIEHPPLIALMAAHFAQKPVRMPEERLQKGSNGRRVIVTTMKNEGPFILEWIAYHRAIGFDDFLVYTNDCTDGTDELLDVLQAKGVLQHRDNPYRESGLKPQHAALQAAEKEDIIARADWAICMDVDEYINVKCGDGTLDALFDALGEVNMISLTWRLFGNADVHEFDPGFITGQFQLCAPELSRKPHQAWGFKTLFRNVGLFKKLGVHRPKGLKPQLWDQVKWVNGSGKAMPKEMFRNAWRSTTETYGYDLVQLNHYAVRSAESFLVKRDRGRVNHVDRDQGLAYWFRMNNNAEHEPSITRMIPRLTAEVEALLADPEIAAAHTHAVAQHRAKIDALRATETYAAFYSELTGARMQKLSRMHLHFGANVFLQGPEVVPDAVWQQELTEDFFFTVEGGETEH
jgi:hypothetical protein